MLSLHGIDSHLGPFSVEVAYCTHACFLCGLFLALFPSPKTCTLSSKLTIGVCECACLFCLSPPCHCDGLAACLLPDDSKDNDMHGVAGSSGWEEQLFKWKRPPAERN